MEKIINNNELNLNEDNKIIWNGDIIAKLKKGKNYLSPNIEIISDDALDDDSRDRLSIFLKSWLSKYLNEILGDLINLSKEKIENQYIRALVYQLYEKNGVVKRKEVDDLIKLVVKEDRKKIWSMGIKIGRYHIYLPKMLKPKAVVLRISLWKLLIR